MGAAGINLETKPVACLGACDRLVDAAHQGMCPGVDVEEGFSPHRLDDFHHRFKLAGCSCGRSFHDVCAMLGTDSNSGRFACEGGDSRTTGEIHDERAVGFAEKKFASFGVKDALEKIHGGAAKETGDEEVGRLVVDFKRGGDLLDDAVLHHHNPFAHGHGFDLVVGHIDHGRLQLAVKFGDLGAHLHPHLGVEIREGFIKEEDTRLTHDRTTHGHALALAAGEGLRFALEIVGDAEDLSGLHHAAPDFILRSFPEFQTKCHVVVNGHVGVERVVLEDHRDVAVFRRHIVHPAFSDENIAAGDFLQPRDHAQRGGFAAARRADEHDEFPILDFEVEVANRDHFAAFFRRVGFEDAFECNLCHMVFLG